MPGNLIMKTTTGRRRPLAVLAILLSALVATTGLTAAASPSVDPAHAVSLQAAGSDQPAADSPAAHQYISMAFNPSSFAWWATWSDDVTRAKVGALDQCNLRYSNGFYNCISAGYAHNAYLAVAVSRKDGPWGSYASTSATTAGQWALYYCKYYGGGTACHVIFNRHSNER